jgi:putative DNA primase/helicase
MIKYLLGKQNYTALNLEEFDERFSATTMFGKLANIGDDINDEFLSGKIVAQFKKIVSGNDIKAENKGQDVYFFAPTVKLLFSANDIPRMRSRGFAAIKRRLVIIPFNAKFSKDDPDYDGEIKWKLQKREVAEYLITLGLSGLKRVLINKGFTESAKVKNEISEFEKDNNPLLLFFEDCPEDEILNHETKEVFARYELFCQRNGYSKMAMQTFTKAINKYLECERRDIRVDGKKKVIFKRLKDD